MFAGSSGRYSASDFAGEGAQGIGRLFRTEERILRVRICAPRIPIVRCDAEIGLLEWNSPTLWKAEYQGLADVYVFFAEDIFGGQFCFAESGVCQFDPETGQTEEIAKDLEGWAEMIFRDYRVLTGYPLAHEWQRANGALASGLRLVPKIPFVTGGKFELQNLYPLEAVTAMRLRASIAVQIRDRPDGSQIRLKVID